MDKTKYLAAVSYTDTEPLVVLKVLVVTGRERADILRNLPVAKLRILLMYRRARVHDIRSGVITRYRSFLSDTEFPPVDEISSWLKLLKITKDASDYERG